MLQHSSSMQPAQPQSGGQVLAMPTSTANPPMPGTVTPPSPIKAPGARNAEPSKGLPEGSIQVSPTSILELAASAASWQTGSASQGDHNGSHQDSHDSQESSSEGSQGLHDSPRGSEPASLLSTPAAAETKGPMDFDTAVAEQLAGGSSEVTQHFIPGAAVDADAVFHHSMRQGQSPVGNCHRLSAAACEQGMCNDTVQEQPDAQGGQPVTCGPGRSDAGPLQYGSRGYMHSHPPPECQPTLLPASARHAAKQAGALVFHEDAVTSSMPAQDAASLVRQEPAMTKGQQHHHAGSSERLFHTPEKVRGRGLQGTPQDGRSSASHSPSSSLDSSYEAVVHELKDHLAQPSPPRQWATDENSPTRKRQSLIPAPNADPVRPRLRAIRTGAIDADRQAGGSELREHCTAVHRAHGSEHCSVAQHTFCRLEASQYEAHGLQNQVPNGDSRSSPQADHHGAPGHQSRSTLQDGDNGSWCARAPLQVVPHSCNQNLVHAQAARAFQATSRSPFEGPITPKAPMSILPSPRASPAETLHTPKHSLATPKEARPIPQEALSTPLRSGARQTSLGSRTRTIRVRSPLPASPTVMGNRVRKASQNMQQALKASPSRPASPYPGTSPCPTPRGSHDGNAGPQHLSQIGEPAASHSLRQLSRAQQGPAEGPGNMQEQLAQQADALWSCSMDLYRQSPSGVAATPAWVQRSS